MVLSSYRSFHPPCSAAMALRLAVMRAACSGVLPCRGRGFSLVSTIDNAKLVSEHLTLPGAALAFAGEPLASKKRRGWSTWGEEKPVDELVNRVRPTDNPSLPRRRNAPDRPRSGEVGGEDVSNAGAFGLPFSSLDLPPELISRLSAYGLHRSTPIQAAAIPLLMEGHDAAIQSYTGSGKTLAYLIPLLLSVAEPDWPSDRQQRLSSVNAQGSSPSAELNEVQVSEPPAPAAAISRLATARPGSAATSSRTRAGSGVQAIVVAPSQELAMQIVREAQRLVGPHHKNTVQQLIGGANQRRQEEALKRNKPQVVVGTPGRIAEMSRAGRLLTHGCRFLVLDEADALLSHRFRPDMLRILEHVGARRTRARDGSSSSSSEAERQTVLVSATLSGAVVEAANRWGRNPLLIQVPGNPTAEQSPPEPLPGGPVGGTSGAPSSSHLLETYVEELRLRMVGSGNSASAHEVGPAGSGGARRGRVHDVAGSLSPTLNHCFVVAEQRHKVDALRRCLHATGAQSAMVFMNFPRRLQDVQHKLEARGITVGVLHGQMQKLARATVLAAFRTKEVQVLLVSDLGARGLDIVDCDLVVNLELPSGPPHYAHRAGRTGRIGRRGTVVSICEASEAFVMEKLQRQLGVPIRRVEAVGGELVAHGDITAC